MKLLYPLFLFILLLISLSAFTGCNYCEDRKEPEARVIFSISKIDTFLVNSQLVIDTFYYDTLPPYEKIFELHTQQELDPVNWDFQIPFSLHTDSVTFVFQNGQDSDTLGLAYDLDLHFQSRKCGYVAEIRNVRKSAINTLNIDQINPPQGLFLGRPIQPYYEIRINR